MAKKVPATHREFKTTKGWRKASPKSRRERRILHNECGSAAFLNSAKLSYPVMSKDAGREGVACTLDCRGLRSAKARAEQYGNATVANKADRLGRRAGCEWAREG